MWQPHPAGLLVCYIPKHQYGFQERAVQAPTGDNPAITEPPTGQRRVEQAISQQANDNYLWD